MDLAATFGRSRPLIATIHLPGLPGSPAWVAAGRPSVRALAEQVGLQFAAFREAGFDAAVIENFGDAPFYPSRVPPETIAAMAVIGASLPQGELPLGVNVLRNDGFAALALAGALGAAFLRVNILNGVSATDQGLIAGEAHALLRERDRLGLGPGSARPVAILADVHVKHARPLGEPDIALAAADLAERGGADAIVVSGARTGSAASRESIQAVKRAAGETPVLLGSGLTAENAAALWPEVDGGIAASAALRGGRAGQPVDPERAAALVVAVRRADSQTPPARPGG